MSEECIFCRIVSGEIPSQRVYEDVHAIAFRDLNPQAPTHCLVIPKKHKPRLDSYGNDAGDAEELGHVLLAVNKTAKVLGLEDFRTVINCGPGAQQTVFHLHVHLLAGRDFAWPPG